MEFLGAVGLAYATVWGIASLATSSNSARVAKSNAQKGEKSPSASSLCPFCVSRLTKLQNELSSSSSNNNNNNQLQLQLAILVRLLQDRKMLVDNDNNKNNKNDSCCCSCTQTQMIPLPLLSLESSQTTFRSLDTPTNFYETLLNKISSAQRRIVISSLYIGSGPRSKNLITAIQNKLASNPDIELLIVLDYCRMHIGPNLSAISPILEQIGENGQNFDVEEKVSRSGNQRVALFCPPSWIGKVLKKFGRVREAQGVQHTKLFVFDDDVILSGANLSDDYFLDRMDRYILVEHKNDSNNSSSPLANHVVTLAKTVASISFQLFPGNIVNNSDLLLRPCCNGKMFVGPNLYRTNPDTQHKEFTESCESAMRQFEENTSMSFNDWMEKLESQLLSSEKQQKQGTTASAEKFETFVIPSVQFARAGVFSDMSVMETLLSFETTTTNSSCSSVIQRVIASPYLNTHHAFLDKMFQVCQKQQQKQKQTSSKLFRFVTCSPESNAWKGSRGAAGLLPQLYYSLVRSFYFLAEDRNFAPNMIQVREFEKYHLVDHNGEYSNLPEGVSVGVFSPYVRPDDEEVKESNNNKQVNDKNDDQENNNQNQNKANYFPRSTSSAERFTEKEKEQENADSEQELKIASATFHAKGVWIATAPSLPTTTTNARKEEEKSNESENEAATVISTLTSMSDNYDSQPFATVVGSNNLGERCIFKDLESDYLIITCDKRVQRTLAEEVSAILKHSEPVARNDFLSNSSSKLGRFQPVIEVVGSMMSSYL